jgi:peptidyl-tRNA hydrolase
MSPGKIAAQAGHAYLGAAVQADPSTLSEYHADFPGSPGTKVCLQTDSVDKLKLALDKAQDAGIPHFLVIDSGCPNFHGGQPIITALGLGPARRAEINNITRKFKLVE